MLQIEMENEWLVNTFIDVETNHLQLGWMRRCVVSIFQKLIILLSCNWLSCLLTLESKLIRDEKMEVIFLTWHNFIMILAKDKTVGTPWLRTYIRMYISTCLEFVKLEYMYFYSIYVCKTRTYVFLMVSIIWNDSKRCWKYKMSIVALLMHNLWLKRRYLRWFLSQDLAM